jgi:hypothetical protein
MLKSSPLSSKDTFAALLEIELKRSLRYQNYLALLLIEARTGSAVNWEPENGSRWSKMTSVVRSVVRETDLIGVSEQNLLTIMLINSDNKAASVVADRLGNWVPLCLGAGSGLSIGGACFPTNATDLTSLYQSAAGMLAAARIQQDVCYRIL